MLLMLTSGLAGQKLSFGKLDERYKNSQEKLNRTTYLTKIWMTERLHKYSIHAYKYSIYRRSSTYTYEISIHHEAPEEILPVAR